MKIEGWKRLFAPHILERGLDYYESELVTVDSMDEQLIEAMVEGTETYRVEIVLYRGKVQDMVCDCPYADAGNNCKHMAAVLFAAEEEEADVYSTAPTICDAEEGTEAVDESALEQSVSALSPDRLRRILINAAKKHADVRDAIQFSGQTAVTPDVRRRWERDLGEISYRASDRDEYIDYEHAFDYTLELKEYLDEAISPLLENRLIMDAFELVGLVYTEAMQQYIDDSDGGLCFVADCCEEYWRELICAPEADHQKMFAWFEEELRLLEDNVGAELLWPVIFSCFDDPKILTKIQRLLDRWIETAEEYKLQGLVEQRIEIMKRLGASPAEIEEYKMGFWKYPFIRKKELDRLEAAGQWDKALNLLRECENLDGEDACLLAGYSERRIRLLQGAGQEAEYLTALKEHVFRFPQRDLNYVELLKRLVSENEWTELRDKLLASPTLHFLRRDFQMSEGMQEQVLKEIEDSGYPSGILEYEKELRELYPVRVRELLIKHFDMQMEQASNRVTYADIARSIKQLYGYPQGKEKAVALAAGWRAKYPRRRAMLEELDKQKL